MVKGIKYEVVRRRGDGFGIGKRFMSMDEAYERMKKIWMERNPQATPQQYQQAMREIARKLNI